MISADLFRLAATMESQAMHGEQRLSPLRLRALACVLRDLARQADALERATLAQGATNVVPLRRPPALTPVTGGAA